VGVLGKETDEAREMDGVDETTGNIEVARDRDDVRGRSGVKGTSPHPNSAVKIAVSEGTVIGVEHGARDSGSSNTVGVGRVKEEIVERSKLSCVEVCINC
jgi:hypothetical protein